MGSSFCPNLAIFVATFDFWIWPNGHFYSGYDGLCVSIFNKNRAN